MPSQLIPGDPATSDAGHGGHPRAASAALQRAARTWTGLLLARYGDWLRQFLHGDMGTSYSYHMSVASMVGPKLPITAVLTLMAFVLTVVVSIPLGIATARREGGWF